MYPFSCKEIQPVHSEGDQPWDFFGRTDAKAETPVLCPPHVKSWLIGKDSDAGRDRGQEEKGTTEDEMAVWHHGLDGHESEWTPGVGDGQGILVCCSPWGCKELDRTEQLNWTELNWTEQGINVIEAGEVSQNQHVAKPQHSNILIVFFLNWERKKVLQTAALALIRDSSFLVSLTAHFSPHEKKLIFNFQPLSLFLRKQCQPSECN